MTCLGPLLYQGQGWDSSPGQPGWPQSHSFLPCPALPRPPLAVSVEQRQEGIDGEDERKEERAEKEGEASPLVGMCSLGNSSICHSAQEHERLQKPLDIDFGAQISVSKQMESHIQHPWTTGHEGVSQSYQESCGGLEQLSAGTMTHIQSSPQGL